MEEKLKAAKFLCKHTVDIDQFKSRVFQSLDKYSQIENRQHEQLSSRKKWTAGIVFPLVVLPSTIGFAYSELSQVYKWNGMTANIQNTGSTPTGASKTTTTSLYSRFESGKEDAILSNFTRVSRKLADLAESRKAAAFPIHDANNIGDWIRIDGYGTYGISIYKKADGSETATIDTTFLAGYSSLFKNRKVDWISVTQTSNETHSEATFSGNGVRRLDGFGNDFAVILPNSGAIGRLQIFHKQDNQLFDVFDFESYADSSTIIAFAHEFLNTPTQ